MPSRPTMLPANRRRPTPMMSGCDRYLKLVATSGYAIGREPIPPLAQQDAIQRHGNEDERQIGERGQVEADCRRTRRAHEEISTQADERGAEPERGDEVGPAEEAGQVGED